MAEIIQEEKQEGGKRKPKKHSTHIDMTPMVDLMCLLITFFMLTTAFSKPKVMEITMPEKDNKPDPKTQTKVQADRTYNILLTGDNKIYWYEALVLLIIYILYATFMKFNHQVEKCVKKVIYKNKVTRVRSTDQLMPAVSS